jgi:ABC-type histidine transport system ATPase subunit
MQDAIAEDNHSTEKSKARQGKAKDKNAVRRTKSELRFFDFDFNLFSVFSVSSVVKSTFCFNFLPTTL